MRIPEGWELFQTFTDQGSAQVMCEWLIREGVPSTIQQRALENAREAEHCLLVEKRLAHRARWVVAQLPPSDEELEYLATGKLPSTK
jgi:hypothetical protein